jgi:membrane glycosyltransferase
LTARHLFRVLIRPAAGRFAALLSISMTVLTSKVGAGTAMRAHNYLLIPEETKSPAVLRRAWSMPANWRGHGP